MNYYHKQQKGQPVQIRLSFFPPNTYLRNKKSPDLQDFSLRRQPDLNRWSGCCRPTPYRLAMSPYDSYGNRTRVTAVKGRCLDRLTKEPYMWNSFRCSTPPVGLEPTTTRLTAECSTDWAKEEYPWGLNRMTCIQVYHVPSKLHIKFYYNFSLFATHFLDNSRFLAPQSSLTSLLVKPSTY